MGIKEKRHPGIPVGRRKRAARAEQFQSARKPAPGKDFGPILRHPWSPSGLFRARDPAGNIVTHRAGIGKRARAMARGPLAAVAAELAVVFPAFPSR